jgi:hypothetical protein
VRAGLLAVRDQRAGALTLPGEPVGIVAHDVCAVSGGHPGPACPTKRERFIEGADVFALCPGH